MSIVAGGLLLLALAAVSLSPATARLLQRVDYLIYDLLLPVQSPSMSEQITVVAIDNRSIRELGRWPWSRSVHAELLERLFDMQAAVVGVDVLLAERQIDNPAADKRLADAIGRGRVVLPVAPSRQEGSGLISEILPVPEFAVAATGLGHVDVELDRDGLSRSTFLYGGVGEAGWPSLPLAMLQAAGDPVARRFPRPVQNQYSGGWLRAEQVLVPFTRPGDGPRIVSFSDVLEGRVDVADIAGRYVLVGATATGLGDAISTPGAFSHERMPGVVLNAQILNGLVQGEMIEPLDDAQKHLRSLIILLAVVLAMLTSPARINVLIAVGGMLLVIAVSAVFLARAERWFPPATTLVPLLLAWPLWTAWQYQRARQLSDRLLRQLEHQARYHLVTDLPNHRMLEDRLRLLADGSEESGTVALMIMHIHWPGSATVAMDRPISDLVLQAIGERLNRVVRPDDFVAHLSNEDFAVLSQGYASSEDAQRAATDFLKEMQEPLNCGEEHVLLAPEIGVSLWPHDTTDPRNLLRNAYTAMFKSRLDDTDQLCVYSKTVSGELQTRSQLEQALMFALERREFSVHYQPQISVRSSRIVGVEALVRWNNPILGWVSPSAFVPVAEHVGLIRSIGAWVIEDACRQLQAWNRGGFNRLRMAINVSPLQFMVPGLEDDIQEIVLRLGVQPGFVELEITESSLMHDMDSAVRTMNRIKDLGLELAIDDFGTGYSSLSNLRHFPLDRLKIDQTFIQDIGRSGHAERITTTIIAMGRHLGLRVIAEGVETDEQAAFLRNEGCDEFQGFLFGRPMPPEELTRLLTQQSQK